MTDCDDIPVEPFELAAYIETHGFDAGTVARLAAKLGSEQKANDAYTRACVLADNKFEIRALERELVDRLNRASAEVSEARRIVARLRSSEVYAPAYADSLDGEDLGELVDWTGRYLRAAGDINERMRGYN